MFGKKREARLQEENRVLQQLFKHPGRTCDDLSSGGKVCRWVLVEFVDGIDKDKVKKIYEGLLYKKSKDLDTTDVAKVSVTGSRDDWWNDKVIYPNLRTLTDGQLRLIFSFRPNSEAAIRTFMLWLAQDYDKIVNPVTVAEPVDFIFLNERNKKGKFKWLQPW